MVQIMVFYVIQHNSMTKPHYLCDMCAKNNLKE